MVTVNGSLYSMYNENKFNYDELYDIESIEFEYLDNDTLINWEVLRLWEEVDNEEWICIEVWLDEDNDIKILQQSEEDSEEISKYLSTDLLDHIHTLVKKGMEELK